MHDILLMQFSKKYQQSWYIFSIIIFKNKTIKLYKLVLIIDDWNIYATTDFGSLGFRSFDGKFSLDSALCENGKGQFTNLNSVCNLVEHL